jgi:small-conductance mechanosensitive channel
VNSYSSSVKGLVPSSSIFSNITRIIVMLLGILVALQSLGISITPIITALGVGGLAVALALQDTLSNLFSGIQIIASNQIKPNDFIKLASGEEGYVTDISWRNTVIKALPNHIIVVPNSKLAGMTVINYTLPDKEIAVLVPIGVHYKSDLEHVERVTIQTAREVMQANTVAAPNFDPFIRFNSFGDSSINFTVILRVNEFVDQHILRHEFIKAIHEAFKRENIQIPFPIRTVHLEQSK